MTREERLKEEIDKLYEKRSEAMRRNDFLGMSRYDAKIKAKQSELEECRQYHPVRLLDILNEQGENVKNKVYKALIKISLAADFVNDCAEDAKYVMKELGLNDFTLKAEAAELCKLSQKIASFVIIPGQIHLTDMLVDNDDFIQKCHTAADKHLENTLKL